MLNIEKNDASRGNAARALGRVRFGAQTGEFLAVMGAPGPGKTTLLRRVSGFNTASAGKILPGGVNLAGLSEEGPAKFRRGRPGFVFRGFNLQILNVPAAPGGDASDVI